MMDAVEMVENSGDTDGDAAPTASYVSDIFIEDQLVRCILIAVQVIAMILAAAGNSLLIAIILRHWKKHSNNVTAYLVLNLAVTELIRTVIHQPMRLFEILLPETVSLKAHLSSHCKALGFLSAFFAGVGFHTIVAISIERVMLICYPLQAKGILTVHRMKVIIFCIWVTTFLATLPLPVFFTFIAAVPLKEQNITFCLIDIVSESYHGRIYYVVLFLLYYAIPVVVITSSYSRIFCTLNKQVLGTRAGDVSVQRVLRARKSLAKMMLSIAVIFTLFQGPYFLTFLCLCLGVRVHSNHVFLLLVIEFLPLISSLLNPLIYTANSTSWRKGLLGYRGDDQPRDPSFHKQISVTSFEGTFRLKTMDTRRLCEYKDGTCRPIIEDRGDGTPL